MSKGQSDFDERLENRLQSLARQMENEHKFYLKSVLNNQEASNDQRAMAIELLTRNQTLQSADILKTYTTNESGIRGAAIEQELIFKARAIEGLAAYQDRNQALSYLNEVSKKTNYKFLKERASRAADILNKEAF